MHTCSIYNSVEDVPREAWDSLVAAGDFAMDRRLIELQKRTLSEQCRMWVVLVRDEGNEPAAIACLARFDLEMLELPAWAKAGVGAVRRVWGSFLKNRVLFVGLPLPCGSSHLRFAVGADKGKALEALDREVRKLARAEGAGYVVYKEFEGGDAADMKALEERGYLRGTLPVMHKLAGGYRDFKGYLGALKARYRNQITRSQRKFSAAGLRAVHVTDAEEIRRKLTPEVHRLYAAVHAKSKVKLEFLPLRFFHELPDALPGQVAVTFAEEKESGRVVGFTLEMRSNEGGGTHYNVYSGVDYEANETAHVYFNLFYHDLDYAFSTGAKELHLGETSDDFKSRLGSDPVPMFCYVRARNPLVRAIVKRFADKVFPKQKVERQDVFKQSCGEKEGAAEREEVGSGTE
ncbi:MAG TPA: GNAT family N-acetyltransferase [Phycisphaerae bacterium]|nr:GNAT family N-acetyltransferase [Phycisphaerae bacterium]